MSPRSQGLVERVKTGLAKFLFKLNLNMHVAAPYPLRNFQDIRSPALKVIAAVLPTRYFVTKAMLAFETHGIGASGRRKDMDIGLRQASRYDGVSSSLWHLCFTPLCVVLHKRIESSRQSSRQAMHIPLARLHCDDVSSVQVQDHSISMLSRIASVAAQTLGTSILTLTFSIPSGPARTVPKSQLLTPKPA